MASRLWHTSLSSHKKKSPVKTGLDCSKQTARLKTVINYYRIVLTATKFPDASNSTAYLVVLASIRTT
jgi:hypothetical protein